MRKFRQKRVILAAVIVAFKGADTVVTDDGDDIKVGDPWITKWMPRLGDVIYRSPGSYLLVRANVVADRFEIPPPLEEQVVETWYVSNEEGEDVAYDEVFTSLDAANQYIVDNGLAGCSATPF